MSSQFHVVKRPVAPEVARVDVAGLEDTSTGDGRAGGELRDTELGAFKDVLVKVDVHLHIRLRAQASEVPGHQDIEVVCCVYDRWGCCSDAWRGDEACSALTCGRGVGQSCTLSAR